jgi:hypothetical protein
MLKKNSIKKKSLKKNAKKKKKLLCRLAGTHAFGEWQRDHECSLVRRCRRGDAEEKISAAHDFSEWSAVVVEECLEVRRCTFCGLTQQRTEHYWEYIASESTRDAAVYRYRCKRCRLQKTSDCSTCHGTGQILGEWVTKNVPNWQGYEETLPCPECGDISGLVLTKEP